MVIITLCLLDLFLRNRTKAHYVAPSSSPHNNSAKLCADISLSHSSSFFPPRTFKIMHMKIRYSCSACVGSSDVDIWVSIKIQKYSSTPRGYMERAAEARVL
jgi:hypothetical protein